MPPTRLTANFRSLLTLVNCWIKPLNGRQKVVGLIPIGATTGLSNPYGFPTGQVRQGQFMREEVCVFYLARAAEGIQPFVDFATSFRRFASGKPHRLVVIYKGFDAEPETPLKAIRDDHLFVSDDLTDIGSYIEAAEQFTSEYVCFFNTFSVILAPNWLHSLRMAIASDLVGIAGATASWESIHDTFAYLGKAIWLTETKKTPVHAGMMRQFGPYLRLHSPGWTSRYLATPTTTKWRSFFRAPYTASDEIGFPEYWKSVTAPGGPLDAYRDIPRFPNPHIRSNGFIIRRADLLVEFPAIERGKHAAHLFESGPLSMTARIMAAGKSAVVVGRNGQIYLPHEWPQSGTFRLGRQSNLLFGDNQTRNYATMPRGERLTQVYLTWAIRPATSRFLTLGMNFESKIHLRDPAASAGSVGQPTASKVLASPAMPRRTAPPKTQ